MRAKNNELANHRLSQAWWDWPELIAAIGNRIKVRVGDVSQPRLGLSNSDYDDILRSVTHIIHSAADLRLDGPIEELRKVNVTGTANILDLAYKIQHDHGELVFHRMSENKGNNQLRTQHLMDIYLYLMQMIVR